MSNLIGNIKLMYRGTQSDAITLEQQKFVTLEQEYIPKRNQFAGLYDAFKMIQLAQSGGSSFNHNLPGNVSLEGNYFKINLNFYLWPYPENLIFQGPMMVGSERNQISLQYKFTKSKVVSKVVPMRNYITLPYSGRVISTSWETPCYDESGKVYDVRPKIQIVNGYIIFDKPVFGILKINTQAVGYKYKATIYVAKSVQDIVYNQVNKNQIKHPECTVMVKHRDNYGREQKALLELILPAYVFDYFEGCPVDNQPEPPPPIPKPPPPIPKPNPDPEDPEDPDPEDPEDLGNLSWYKCFPEDDPVVEIIKVYYSTCSGDVLDTVRVKVPNPCSKDWNK